MLRQHPHTQPNKTKKSPAPRFHAASKAIRDGLREAYGLFLAAFRDAAELLKAGDRSARFPVGSFPPGLPFVRALPPQAASASSDPSAQSEATSSEKGTQESSVLASRSRLGEESFRPPIGLRGAGFRLKSGRLQT